jgi:hypothetical protein
MLVATDEIRCYKLNVIRFWHVFLFQKPYQKQSKILNAFALIEPNGQTSLSKKRLVFNVFGHL